MRRHNAKERSLDELDSEYPCRVFASRPVAVPRRRAAEKVFYEDEPPPRVEIPAGAGVVHLSRAYAGHAARQAQLRKQGEKIVFDPAIGGDVVRPVERVAKSAAAAQPVPVDPAGCDAPAADADDILSGCSPESFGHHQ